MGSFDLAGELANTTAEERGTKLHDVGDYTFVVKSAEDGGLSKNGVPFLKTKVEFLEPPYRGHVVSRDIYYSNKSQGAIRMFWQQLQALGISEDYLQETGQTTFDAIAQLITNAQFEGNIRHREFPVGEGVYREEVNIRKFISNPNVGDPSAVTGQVQPPAGPEPELFEDEEETPAAEPETVSAAAGVATDADDPWGAADK